MKVCSSSCLLLFLQGIVVKSFSPPLLSFQIAIYSTPRAIPPIDIVAVSIGPRGSILGGHIFFQNFAQLQESSNSSFSFLGKADSVLSGTTVTHSFGGFVFALDSIIAKLRNILHTAAERRESYIRMEGTEFASESKELSNAIMQNPMTGGNIDDSSSWIPTGAAQNNNEDGKIGSMEAFFHFSIVKMFSTLTLPDTFLR